jgi:hypothetical protein
MISETMYLSGAVGPGSRALGARPDLGLLIQPGTRSMVRDIPTFGLWAADNGCFSKKVPFNEEKWLAFLEAAPRENCLFATAPDVVGDARATWARSEPWLEELRRRGYPAALVLQNGQEELGVPWDACDAIFIGGDDEWKCSAYVVEIIAEARARGHHTHVGRVNTKGRLRWAALNAGADTVDGTKLAFGEQKNLPALMRWLDELQVPRLF